jgi:hypothetical protein
MVEGTGDVAALGAVIDSTCLRGCNKDIGSGVVLTGDWDEDVLTRLPRSSKASLEMLFDIR